LNQTLCQPIKYIPAHCCWIFGSFTRRIFPLTKDQTTVKHVRRMKPLCAHLTALQTLDLLLKLESWTGPECPSRLFVVVVVVVYRLMPSGPEA